MKHERSDRYSAALQATVKDMYIVMKANCKVVNITCFNISRFYARDVKDGQTHLTSEMLTFTGENDEKTGSIKVDD